MESFIFEEYKIITTKDFYLGFRTYDTPNILELNVSNMWDLTKDFDDFVELFNDISLAESICKVEMDVNKKDFGFCERGCYLFPCPIMCLFNKNREMRDWDKSWQKVKNTQK